VSNFGLPLPQSDALNERDTIGTYIRRGPKGVKGLTRLFRRHDNVLPMNKIDRGSLAEDWFSCAHFPAMA
jgi:hypothetical protein